MTKETCAICGEQKSEHTTKTVSLTYKSITFRIAQPGHWCEACGEGVLNPGDRKAVQKDIQHHKSQIDGILTPDEVKLIREMLNISQKEAGLRFGGGINAFNRYEQGVTPLPKPLSHLLLLLKNHPDQISEIPLATGGNESSSHRHVSY